LYANRAALKLFECSEAELLTRNFSDIDAACKNGGRPIFVDALRTAGAVEPDVAMRGTSAHSILLGLNIYYPGWRRRAYCLFCPH